MATPGARHDVVPDSCTASRTLALDPRNEFMMHRLIRLQPSLGIPPQTPGDKVQKRFIVTLERLRQCFGTRSSPPTLAAHCHPRLAHAVEKQLLPATLLDQMLLRWPKYLHDARQLFLFVLARENWIACQQLSQYAPQAPHVDRNAVAHAENHFR